MTDLTPFYAPRSIAVVGAGDRPTSSGGAVVQMLVRAGYTGRLVPINPKGGVAFGHPVVPSLSALDQPVELVVIVIRPDAILEAVAQAAASGHRHLLILPGGFAEAGAPGLARQTALDALIESHGLVVAGPNCAGLINLARGEGVAASFLRDLPYGVPAGGRGVALVSQSGAIAEDAIAASHRLSVPLATVVSVGNAAKIGVADHLEHLAADPSIGVVLLYLESLGDAERFGRAARRAAAVKPVVALFGGVTPAGAAAAERHTGARPRTDPLAELAAMGVVTVAAQDDLWLAGKAFAAYPNGAGPRVLIVSNSGGPGVLIADAAVAAGLTLPALPEAMAAALSAGLPPEAAVANPIDLLADAREERFALALEVGFAADPPFDQILCFHTAPFMVDPAPVVAAVAAVAARAPCPLFHAMAGTVPERAAWFAALDQAGVPVVGDGQAMARMAGVLARYHRLAQGLTGD